ncbi:MAG: DUF362 domain-containing protein [Anaerolineae bacterium]|nr:DUF362 domain-containing protein [Anaerolineae bacterium]
MNRRKALQVMILAVAAAIVSCRKDPLVAPEPEPIQSSTEAQLPTQTPLPSATPVAGEPAAVETEATIEPQQAEETQPMSTIPTVYMTAEISADGLIRIYEALDHKAHGKVAVKISSGEPGGHHFLSPDLIEPLVSEVQGTIVECNTAYGGKRANTTSHEQTLIDHGFTAIAPTDIMDAEGDLELPIVGGKYLTAAVVGSHYANYNFTVNLAHFKGHAMAGFGGVIKNMSIGISSAKGKGLIHSAGASTRPIWSTEQNAFLESMVEAAKGMADYVGENIIYINVMNNLSVDCDCDSHPAAPTMADIGILASLDPVAVDQACIDLVYAASDSQDLVKRIESRNGLHTLEHAAAMGMGSREYELVRID